MGDYPSILLVFSAGLLSFLSPCVLPLIPSYLSILGSAKERKPVLLVTTVCFVLGFTAVFIVLSIIMSATFLLMGGISFYIRIAAGFIVIILGLNVIFDFISVLNYEKRFHITGKPRGLPERQEAVPETLRGSFDDASRRKLRDLRFWKEMRRAGIAGAAFGAGWTPCIGPILAGVLFLAGQSGKTGIAALYLAVYSLGLGLPFLLAAAFFDRFLVSSKWFRKHLPLIQKISGILLIIIGLLILSGRFSVLTISIQKWQYQYIEWAQDKALPFRVLADWLGWLAGL